MVHTRVLLTDTLLLEPPYTADNEQYYKKELLETIKPRPRTLQVKTT